MIGIIIGTAAILGTAAFCRRRLHRYGWHHRGHAWHHAHDWHHGHRGCQPGFGGYGDTRGWNDDEHSFRGERGDPRRGGFGFGAERWASMLAWRLEASPSQAQVIRDVFRGVQDELRSVADERTATTEDVGKAVGGELFDEQILGEVFSRHDRRLEQIRRSVVDGLAKIHAVLEPVQRERLAALLGKRGFGPYRM